MNSTRIGLVAMAMLAGTTAACASTSQYDQTGASDDAVTGAPASAASFEGQWTSDLAFQTGPDSPADITYTVTVHGSSVLFSGDGYQTDIRINGKGAVSGSDFVVTFDSCGQEDQFQCSSQQPGEKLFHLHRSGTATTLVWDGLMGEGHNLPARLTDTGIWSGSWAATVSIPEQSASVTYMIGLSGDIVSIAGDGMDTDVRMKGKARAAGNDLYVDFDSCLPGDQFGCTSETAGETLFHLHKEGDAITLIWDQYDGVGKNLPVVVQQ